MSTLPYNFPVFEDCDRLGVIAPALPTSTLAAGAQYHTGPQHEPEGVPAAIVVYFINLYGLIKQGYYEHHRRREAVPEPHPEPGNFTFTIRPISHRVRSRRASREYQQDHCRDDEYSHQVHIQLPDFSMICRGLYTTSMSM